MPDEPQGSACDVAFEDRDGVCIARLSGDLSGDDCWRVLDCLAKGALAGAREGVVVDLTGVTYVASFALGKLLRFGQRCRERDLPLMLAGAPIKIRRVIERVGVAAALGHYATVEEAIAATRGV